MKELSDAEYVKIGRLAHQTEQARRECFDWLIANPEASGVQDAPMWATFRRLEADLQITLRPDMKHNHLVRRGALRAAFGDSFPR
jgi:hypothetical protein